MSHRHVPRQPDRDVRMHEPSHPHPHALITHPPHPAPAHPPHLNGSSATLPSTPASLSNGSNHPHPPANQIVSPVVVPNPPPPNGVAPASSTVIHKLAVANEQTWLLIGVSNWRCVSGCAKIAFISQAALLSKWVILNTPSQHMKMLCGITRYPCQGLLKLRESPGSKKTTQR